MSNQKTRAFMIEWTNLFENYPKPFYKAHRQLHFTPTSKNLLYGASYLGKTDFILHFYAQKAFANQKKMYVNLCDPKIQSLHTLDAFCQKEQIQILILDNYHSALELPKVPHLTIITQAFENLLGFCALSVLPLCFEEYLHLHKLSLEEAFNNFLKYGGLFQSLQLNDYQKIQLLKLQAFDEQNFWMLQYLISHLGQKISLHQIFSQLKKQRKLSKDRFYAYIAHLQKNGLLYLLKKFPQQLANKKIYFWDFTIKNCLSFERNFLFLFENMVFLELFYLFGEEIYYTDSLDFFIPNLSLGILCSPFMQHLPTKINRLLKEKTLPKKLIILTLNQKQTGSFGHLSYQMFPFSEFALQKSNL